LELVKKASFNLNFFCANYSIYLNWMSNDLPRQAKEQTRNLELTFILSGQAKHLACLENV